MFARRYADLDPKCQQTGVLTHEAVKELPFKPVDLRQKDKRVEEKMYDVVTALKGWFKGLLFIKD